MNLHIVPDNVFVNKFYENLCELGIQNQNKLIVRTNRPKLKYVRHELSSGKLYSKTFAQLTGDTYSYDKVFIHQFTPLLYRWVWEHKFKELNWMVWGSDLYNLPFLKAEHYEELTRIKYISRRLRLQDLLYNAKVLMLHQLYRKKAYHKVDNILTWMKSEYEFAVRNLPGLQADHRFFFYENETPYKALEGLLNESDPVSNERPLYVLGNSATPELNHLDAVALLADIGLEADLLVPLSYGDDHYRAFIKKAVSFYQGGKVEFIETYMDFTQYLQLLNRADGLIMNNVRPQGYGNIFIMMYLGKKIILNKKNLSIPELENAGLQWMPLESIRQANAVSWSGNRLAVTTLLSHENLLATYWNLFS